ncbi:hypothetical protein OS190_06730 [Sulfitobacter sp. F26204]|uniref:hypothetical protein n=1 Tax=Sulfitobacter sp. F26204 TaxID=2996014 RepID=UPI00225E642D|nr:hypothetical protein [Sulfitobacter sp. F26204]MCX7559260.1 hypothetical protein [Sulfitobacter sp. F26204]
MIKAQYLTPVGFLVGVDDANQWWVQPPASVRPISLGPESEKKKTTSLQKVWNQSAARWVVYLRGPNLKYEWSNK